MKLNRFGAFTFGVLITTVSVGAVTYVNAAGDANIKACANKTTGAMRYISKGSCKKTEKALSWNQIGPQGLQGAAGSKGDTGATGSDGQNLYLVDSQDREIGMVYGTERSGHGVDFLFEGGLWHWDRREDLVQSLSGSLTQVNFYSDSSCTTNLYSSGDEWFLSTDRGWNQDNINPRYVKPTGNRIATAATAVYGKVPSGTSPNFIYTCTVSTAPSFISWFVGANTDDVLPAYLTAVLEVNPPQFTKPLRIVQK